MCRREAIHHRRCGHVLVHQNRCPSILSSPNPKRWCQPITQLETSSRCKKCRHEKAEGAQAKEEKRDYKAAQQGLRVPRGTLDWHPAVKNVFGRVGDLFRGRNDRYEEVDCEVRSSSAEHRKKSGRSAKSADNPAKLRGARKEDTDLDEEARTLISEEDDIFDEEFEFGASQRRKGLKKSSPRDSQYGSEQ